MEQMKQRNLQTKLLFPKTFHGLDFGGAAQLAREMEKFCLDIMGISEVRWTTAGSIKLASGHSLLFSGLPSENVNHLSGVGLLLTKKACKSLLEWEPISDRVIRARFHSRFRDITIIQCYAPTNQADDDIKEEFYAQLQSVVDKASKHDITIVMGDMNAKVGNNNSGKEFIMGREGLGDMNENGELFTGFCGLNDFVIGGTMFAQKDIHKATWTSPDKSVNNQIDHIAISCKWRRSLNDVRAYRAAEIGSDHELLIAKLQVKIASVKKRGITKSPRFDTTKYPQEKHEFSINRKNRFEALYNIEKDSLEMKWQHKKNTFTSVCEEKLGRRTQTYKTWLSDSTIQKIETKSTVRQKLLQARTKDQTQRVQREYNTIQKEVKKSCRKDKRDKIDQLASKAETAALQKDMSTLYNITRQLSGHQTHSMKPVKDTNGNILSKPEDQLKRWKEHFDQVPNATSISHPPNIEEGLDLEINIGPVTKQEVMKAINKLKSGKAAGPDRIPPEAMKASADVTADIMLDLIQTAWDTEKVPVEWQTGYIVKLQKKGDLSNTNNWRGIQLLSLPSKVLARIILERIKSEVNKVLREEQAGFRTGRSCADQIATLRMIIEQSIEWNCPLYVNFIDFKKAFDSVDRETIWKIMRQYGIPEKIVHIIRNLHDNNLCHVIHNMDLSEPFEVHTGVRHGCLLSPMISRW